MEQSGLRHFLLLIIIIPAPTTEKHLFSTKLQL